MSAVFPKSKSGFALYFLALIVIALIVLIVQSFLPKKRSSLPEEVRKALVESASFELMALEPSKELQLKGETFHGWHIIGKTTVVNADSRAAVEKALRQAAKEHDLSSVIMCFIPRHGIRVSQAETTLDLVICFQCEKLHLYRGNNEKDYQTVYLKGSAQPAMDRILTDARIPLSDK